ncbi:MAG: hypothetical protein MRY83_06555 [Flavobacteriales bacterium]|nr:hypothetical protein [Flavobacteriales bacterium]
MKKKLVFGLASLSLVTILLTSQSNYNEIPDYCLGAETKTKCRKALFPEYKYDAAKTTKITFKPKKQFKELEIPIYIGEKYRLIWSMEGLPQQIDVEVYDKKYEAKSRDVLFTTRSMSKEDKQFITFDPKKPMRRLYIDYLIPPAEDSVKKGCVVFTLGYKIKK